MIVPDQLKQVVEDLGVFVPQLAFTGGLVLGLYFQRPPMFRIRPTKDADAVIACATHAAYVAFQAEMGKVGTRPHIGEDGEPICRMMTASGNLLDLMPTEAGVLGFGNRWFPLGYETAQPLNIGASQPIRIFPPPVYAAAKVEAYRSRGAADPMCSHDLEDFLMLVACRPSLVEEIAGCDPELRTYLAVFAAEVLALPRLDEIIEGNTGEPVETMLTTLRAIAALA
ncbi:MAG: hypothetical protein JWM80_2793 [Cyanobacteria bacterium RYN_339]|nr:hypothetical protein [Cyanobacteria bacterium RYN_339]